MFRENSHACIGIQHINHPARSVMHDLAERTIQYHLSRAANKSLSANDRITATKEACGVLDIAIKAGLIKDQVAGRP